MASLTFPVLMQTTSDRCLCSAMPRHKLLSPLAQCISMVKASGLELLLSAVSIPDPIFPTATSKCDL